MNWHLTSPGYEYDRGEDIAVYFHPASGNTHLLSNTAAAVLRALATTDLSSEQLAMDMGFEAPDLADDILFELEKINLVELL